MLGVVASQINWFAGLCFLQTPSNKSRLLQIKMDFKFTKSLYFGYARYRLSDGQGDEVYLKINYKLNKFKIVTVGMNINPKFRKEVGMMAEDLLARKHGVNIVEKPLH